ncbi:ribbon-helix-helix domain-containing protein [bacterium]|nr:ribbon-helix-helix domain-containing protein [bacterium]
MVKDRESRATTLSISLTKELSTAVSERVDSGLYTSASELIREALRMLLKSEGAAFRLTSSGELMETGTALQAEKVRRQEPGLSETEIQSRLNAVAEQTEAGRGLRISPQRLKKLRLREEAPESN